VPSETGEDQLPLPVRTNWYTAPQRVPWAQLVKGAPIRALWPSAAIHRYNPKASPTGPPGISWRSVQTPLVCRKALTEAGPDPKSCGAPASALEPSAERPTETPKYASARATAGRSLALSVQIPPERVKT